MSTHAQVKVLLYDYVKGELSPDERKQVDEHLTLCRRCADDAENIRLVVAAMPMKSVAPSDDRPVEFWRTFASDVRKQIESGSYSKTSPWSKIWDEIISFIVVRPAYVSVVSGAVVVMLIAFVMWQRYDPSPSSEQPLQQLLIETPVQPVSNDVRMGEYFRKSKMLLVGITNMKLPENEQIDLSTERKFSRALLHEARYLKNQPIDGRSARLINDLEKILIELANLKDNGNAPNVEIIRGGIHQENLLFKIRVAESVYDSSRTVHNDETIY